MKKKLLLAVVLAFVSMGALFAQLKGNDITGLWYGPKEPNNSVPVLEIFEHQGKYYAYGFGYKKDTAPAVAVSPVDDQNPDPALRSRPKGEVVFLYDVKFNPAKQEWVDGEIYRPLDGKYFYVSSGKLSKDGSTLSWRVSVDKAGMFGTTLEWSRIGDTTLYAKLPKASREVLIKNIPSVRIKK